eukprot:gnl/TRDRNA2_/TRDRNA2_206042_c0_seq1.p2 gnl/TRDRNA2_/TRDRNA2_206042_c0~~gnl/TRDRNA2_/TRDRNA2_206042_c0_seq1.p2  ORF type:complete len:123 (+),score=12.78 gnl/TRDRNA2_/TRDRNA2_206042_c0_seq1:152-520(+)
MTSATIQCGPSPVQALTQDATMTHARSELQGIALTFMAYLSMILVQCNVYMASLKGSLSGKYGFAGLTPQIRLELSGSLNRCIHRLVKRVPRIIVRIFGTTPLIGGANVAPIHGKLAVRKEE